jgi:hypothetical protein
LKNSPRTLAFAAAALATLALAPAATLPAQVATAPAVVIKQPKPKLDKYKGRVLAFNIASIIVQNMDNPRMVWSFQYSTELHAKVADMLSSGPFQPGDKVTVYCNPGTTVAVKIKGKPSKSS